MFRRSRSCNKKKARVDKLSDQKYPGIYEMENGSILECHEYMDLFDDGEPEPYGSVYYTLYENGEEVDGGLMGYRKRDPVTDLAEFIESCGQGRIKRKIADEGSEAYQEIDNSLDDSKRYNKVKGKYGLKNRKTAKGTGRKG